VSNIGENRPPDIFAISKLGVPKNVSERLLGPLSKQEIALVNLVPGSLTGTCTMRGQIKIRSNSQIVKD
jgi:hypothetical protein